MTIVPQIQKQPVLSEQNLTMKPMVITRADGTQEIVYIHDDSPLVRKITFMDKLQAVSIVVGIIGTGLIAYLTYLNLKKMK